MYGWFMSGPKSRATDAVSHGAREVGVFPELPSLSQLDAQSRATGGTDRPRKGQSVTSILVDIPTKLVGLDWPQDYIYPQDKVDLTDPKATFTHKIKWTWLTLRTPFSSQHLATFTHKIRWTWLTPKLHLPTRLGGLDRPRGQRWWVLVCMSARVVYLLVAFPAG